LSYLSQIGEEWGALLKIRPRFGLGGVKGASFLSRNVSYIWPVKPSLSILGFARTMSAWAAARPALRLPHRQGCR